MNIGKFKFYLRSAKAWFSTLSPELEMVRYFPNPFEDYDISNGPVTVDTEDISSQIDNYIKNINKKLPPSPKNVNGGLYVGSTGISYMFYHLTKNAKLSENKELFLEKAFNYLKPALETSVGDKTSFLLGDAGTYALASVIFKEMGNDDYKEMINNYKSLYNNYLNPKFLKCGGDEFFVGRAGYLAGALWISREIKSPIFQNEELYKICDMIVSSGQQHAYKHNSPCPLMYHYYNTEYLGAAHGISFILQMLLSVPGYINYNTTAAAGIKETINFLTSLQTDEGNWPCCLEEIALADHKLVHWCHGAPGTVYLMAKAYLVYNDQKYLNACIKAGEVVWNKGLLRKGPGICHGIAGNGYVFLLLYRLTHDEKYYHRANMFGEFLNSDEFVTEARLPDNPESLYEGTAGTVCFLSDLIVPDTAEFPFQDVF